MHQEAAAADVLSVASLTRLNPDFVINLAREMLEHAGSEPPPPGTLALLALLTFLLYLLYLRYQYKPAKKEKRCSSTPAQSRRREAHYALLLLFCPTCYVALLVLKYLHATRCYFSSARLATLLY